MNITTAEILALSAEHPLRKALAATLPAVKPEPERPKSRYKSKLEARYAAQLETLRAAGGIQWWAYESVKFRMADGAWYTPDFLVVMADGEIRAYECKGFWREAAKVRAKVFFDRFPIELYIVTSQGAGFKCERFKP